MTIIKYGGDNLKKVIYFIIITFSFVFILYCINEQYNRPYPITEIESSKVYAAMEELKGMNESEIKAYTLKKFKSENIKPFFKSGNYINEFKAMTPVLNGMPSLYYKGSEGKVDLTYEKDFKAVLGGFGKSGFEEDRLLCISDDNSDTFINDINGKVLVTKEILTPDYIKFVKSNGAKAIIALDKGSSLYDNKDLNLKSYEGLPTFYVNNDIFEKFKGARTVGYNINFKYEEISSYNVAGYIQGTENKNVIYSANSLSSLAYMFQLMENIKNSKVTPYYNLVFVFLDKTSGENHSAESFLSTVTDKRTDKLVMLGPIGVVDTREVQLSIDNQRGFEVKPLLTSNNQNQYLTIGISDKNVPVSFDIFKNSGLETIYIRDGYIQSLGLTNYNSEEAAMRLISNETLKRDINILSAVNRKIIFNKEFNNVSLLISLIIVFILYIPYYLIELLNIKRNNKVRYFSSILQFLYKYAILFILIFLFIAIIGFIPKDILIKKINGRLYSNYSFKYILNNALLYINYVFHKGFGTYNNVTIVKILMPPMLKTFKLIILSVFIAMFFGIYFGIKNGMKGKDSSGSLASIILISIPDALILVYVLMLIGFLEKHKVFQSFFGNLTVKTFIMPLLCISIIPTVYIWRISYTACIEEVKKDYIRNARARGKKGFYLAFSELLPPILLNVLKSMSSVIMILLSNLVLVEYLYYYPGVAFNLISAYKQGQISLFIPFSLCICLIYLVLTSIFRAWAALIDPYKL